MQVLALHDVSSTDASIIYTLEPVLGAGFSYVLLGEFPLSQLHGNPQLLHVVHLHQLLAVSLRTFQVHDDQ